jgi:hypothetical protein
LPIGHCVVAEARCNWYLLILIYSVDQKRKARNINIFKTVQLHRSSRFNDDGLYFLFQVNTSSLAAQPALHVLVAQFFFHQYGCLCLRRMITTGGLAQSLRTTMSGNQFVLGSRYGVMVTVMVSVSVSVSGGRLRQWMVLFV